jgi:PiT family inorganic phosphate transporter
VDSTSFLILVTGVFGFYMAWNIGANDVANAMGTSVGSRALTYRKAIIAAAVFEFAGALLVGGHVTSTIQGKVLEVTFFEGREIDLALGMMAALVSAGIWLQFATWRGWPASTTHSILGALFGLGLTTGGFGIIKWRMMSQIVLSWIISPVVGGIVAWLVFMLILRGIIRRPDPRRALVQVVPLLLFFFFFITTLNLLFKGLKNLDLQLSTYQVLAVALAAGLLAAGVGLVTVPHAVRTGAGGHSRRQVESIFSVLQVMTACYMAFAHGANDVANAIGPLSAVATILQQGVGALAGSVPLWVLLLGGSGIVSGLATWGWRVMQTVGHNITGIAPTRGFAAEFGAATTVLVCSKLGLPVSTTHTLVGAVVGIGLLRGMQSLNMRLVGQVFASWLITVPFTAALCAILYWILKWIWVLAT